jgi:hypothetical protein
VPFWPAILGLLFLYSMPEWGGWAWAGCILAVVWLVTAAVDRWMFHTEWVCGRCGETFVPVEEGVLEPDDEPEPAPEAPAGEVITLAPTAQHHLADGKPCSICGEWFPHAEFSYGNRDNRSYCRTCNREERVAYAEGGREGARQYREAMRAKWKGAESGVRG